MTIEEAETMIGYIEDEGFELNDWESDFLTSLAKQLDEKQFISRKQAAKLQDIYEQKTNVK